MMRFVLLVAVACLPGSIHAHELFLGSCPSVPPMEDFDMEKFEGLWYMRESFDNNEKCVRWDISKGTENGTWHLKEAKGSGALSAIGISDNDLTTATLRPDPENPAKMRVKWPLNFAGSYDFRVYSTDYESFAGVFLCQQVAFFQRQNAIVLSRTPQLRVDLQQMARLQHPGVKVEYYLPVRQNRCGYDHETISEGAGSSDMGPLSSPKGRDRDGEVYPDGDHVFDQFAS
ncbi:apolipoprotein D-like [Panulirus ornatus]|uniref:apolipoprotein D-like n=1 Tax=Panulirus ornatus TaxID=150431 RepID=UPI003A86DB9A